MKYSISSKFLLIVLFNTSNFKQADHFEIMATRWQQHHIVPNLTLFLSTIIYVHC